MDATLTMYCAACNKEFSGPVLEIREPMWAHHATHETEEFPLTKDGERTAFEGAPIILRCNCGECDFCLEKARKRAIN